MMREMVFSMHEYEIKLDRLGERFTVIPIGDIHRETPNCDTERWLATLRHTRKEIERGQKIYFVGLGDFNDFAAWSDRKKIKNASLHESTIVELDRAAHKHCRELGDELKFTSGRWAGMVQGNHRWGWTYEAGLQGKCSTDYYADVLGTRNLGDLAYIRLNIRVPGKGNKHAIDMVIHHGKAGGKLAGTTINQVDDMRVVFPGADIYIMGHDHRKAAVPLSSLWAQGGLYGIDLKQKRQWLIRSGSFLRGYVKGEASYIVGKILRPTDLGTVRIHCALKRSCTKQNGREKDRVVPDIHVEY